MLLMAAIIAVMTRESVYICFQKILVRGKSGHLPCKLLYFNEDTLQKNMALVKSGTHNLEGKLLIQVLPKCKWK